MVSNQTFLSRFRELQLTCRIPVQAPQLPVLNRRMRLNFAHEHTLQTLHDWSCIVFTYESRSTLTTSDRCGRVYKRTWERYAECNVVCCDNCRGGSVVVWGGISFNGRTGLHGFRGRALTAKGTPRKSSNS